MSTAKKLFIINNFQRDKVLVFDLKRSFVFNHLIFLEGQAGILTNIPMLRDFKQTEEEVESHLRTNEKMKIWLRNWWEG